MANNLSGHSFYEMPNIILENNYMNNYCIRPIRDEDKECISKILTERWGSPVIVTRGNIRHGDQLPCFIAEDNNGKIGLITYHIEDEKCEIVSLDSIMENIGVGSGLIEEVKKKASSSGCKKLWAVTTNDNKKAIRFYKKRGFDMAAVHPNAIEGSRLLKPEIPLIGSDGVRIMDEIMLEMELE